MKASNRFGGSAPARTTQKGSEHTIYASEFSPIRTAEKVFPENDKNAVLQPLSLEDEADGRVVIAVLYRGFIAKCRKPYMSWTIEKSEGITAIPTGLVGSFTTQRDLQSAIDEHYTRGMCA